MSKKTITPEDDLRFCRVQIDRIDDEITQLLKQRFDLVKTIGEIKKEIGLPIVDGDREKEIAERIIENTGLNRVFVKDLMKLIFQESRKQQEQQK